MSANACRRPTVRSLLLLIWAAGVAPAIKAACPSLPAADQARLIEYVRKKHRIEKRIPIGVVDEPVGSSCYRKIRFESKDSTRPWGVDLFLTPDARYLTSDLLDSMIDPVEEERQQRQRFLAGLTRGDYYPALGPPDAPVTITVFSDFQCPYCARFASMWKNEIHPAGGRRARLVFRHLPLGMHAWAQVAAEATACAQDQGNDYFWKLHDALFAIQGQLTAQNIEQQLMSHVGRFVGFDQGKFRLCLSQGRMSARIQRDMTFARQNRISATPTVFLNDRRIDVVAPEQILTLIRQATPAPRR